MATAAQPPPETRERLLLAAVDVFGVHGFDGTSTRMLASAADVNLQAIAYYFGNKEGLYVAATQHISQYILARFAAPRERARVRLLNRAPTADDARAILNDMLSAMAEALLEESSAPIARFVVREQMQPSAAFEHLYEQVMEPLLELTRKMVGILVGADPRSTRVRLRTLALVGSVIFFRTSHATAMRQLGWSQTGSRELTAVRAMIQESTANISNTEG